MSYLTYISPSAYLSLVRTSSNPSPSQPGGSTSKIDVPLNHLRSFLTSYPRPRGITIATLFLLPTLQSFDNTMTVASLVNRPTFILAPAGSGIDYIFPQATDTPNFGSSSAGIGRHAWFLDFTEKGSYPGVVMSQSRMRDIELIINPLSGMDRMDAVGMMPFHTESWVDLLVRATFTSLFSHFYSNPSLFSLNQTVLRPQNDIRPYMYVSPPRQSSKIGHRQ
jgi:hypothetical protein